VKKLEVHPTDARFQGLKGAIEPCPDLDRRVATVAQLAAARTRSLIRDGTTTPRRGHCLSVTETTSPDASYSTMERHRDLTLNTAFS
jgi:hypothetical protein